MYKMEFIEKNSKIIIPVLMIPAFLYLFEIIEVGGFEIKSIYGVIGLVGSLFIHFNYSVPKIQYDSLEEELDKIANMNELIKKDLGANGKND